MSVPDPRTIRRALGVLARLPVEALADLVERLIDALDASEADPDLEEDNEDCCEAGDDRPDRGGTLAGSGYLMIGDADDAEDSDEDLGAVEDEPDFHSMSRRLPLVEPVTQIGVVLEARHGINGRWVAVR